jgi:type IV pilus assembly protein PilY1
MLRALLFGLSLCRLLMPAPLLAAADFPGINYYSVPPLPGAGLKSNVLLMLDNSASAEDLAYSDTRGSCSATTARSCSTNSDCPSGESCLFPYCYDDSYSDKNSYPGYFDRNSYYNYDFSFTGGGRFVARSSPLPTSCASGSGYCPALTGYLYVEMADPALPSTIRTVKTFMGRGNFLNWLTTSRLDLEKQALTGGKFQPDGSGATSGMLIGETRGCQGKKFVKVAADAPQVSFAVSGPIPASTIKTCVIDYLPSPGGPTQIEIYDRQYRKSQCMAAAWDWQTGNLSTAIQDAVDCVTSQPAVAVDDGRGSTTMLDYDNQLFVQAMTYCANPSGPISRDLAANACGPNLHYLHGGKAQSVARNSPIAVCGSGGNDFNHVTVGMDNKGFLGRFYVEGSNGGISSASVIPSPTADGLRCSAPVPPARSIPLVINSWGNRAGS